ncbi:hypothetical protein [Allorhizocola rhizosphaerae]|uniref:hypothetical protein n=1 Tax=Allorhizocola rhizosphaerae TaxID=1872709 RepID=UPI0013C2FA8D|nr:hypothetical protein [Allorhizocola rhizosphaerae]
MTPLAMISVLFVMLLTGATQPSPSLDTNTKQVCEQSRRTVDEGMKSLTAELDRAGTAATGGDRATADRHVKQSGTVLTELAGKLREHGEQARNQELRSAIDDMAKELDALGTGLTGLTALQDLDTDHLEGLAERVAEICGTN